MVLDSAMIMDSVSVSMDTLDILVNTSVTETAPAPTMAPVRLVAPVNVILVTMETLVLKCVAGVELAHLTDSANVMTAT